MRECKPHDPHPGVSNFPHENAKQMTDIHENNVESIEATAYAGGESNLIGKPYVNVEG